MTIIGLDLEANAWRSINDGVMGGFHRMVWRIEFLGAQPGSTDDQ